MGLFKNERVSKAIIQKFFLGILTNFEEGVEELWVSKSFGYKKSYWVQKVRALLIFSSQILHDKCVVNSHIHTLISPHKIFLKRAIFEKIISLYITRANK